MKKFIVFYILKAEKYVYKYLFIFFFNQKI